jgi:hypothetical protein
MTGPYPQGQRPRAERQTNLPASRPNYILTYAPAHTRLPTERNVAEIDDLLAVSA